ncbi:hypothetical protein AX16_001921 [Volvariella volvacea WC 439]|nr:hypothetical protein AX16_001921 [Volvariella volvacea WC 439]
MAACECRVAGCCILVGQMKTAMLEIRDKYRPDRIIIESSGSAFPATLAFQIRELERETNGGFKLDAIVTVVDAENFTGYEDTSPTAKMQASYTDIILINKWEHVSERQLDLVLDHLATLNDFTPKIRCQGRNGVDPRLIFGLETKLFLKEDSFSPGNHNDEVETVTLYRGSALGRNRLHPHVIGTHHTHTHESQEHSDSDNGALEQSWLSSALEGLAKDVVWRVKGFVRCEDEGNAKTYILNWAFGRHDLTLYEGELESVVVKLTVMGERGEVRRAARKFGGAIGAELV